VVRADATFGQVGRKFVSLAQGRATTLAGDIPVDARLVAVDADDRPIVELDTRLLRRDTARRWMRLASTAKRGGGSSTRP
jgi:hypothetical protein